MDPNETLRLMREAFSDWEDTRGGVLIDREAECAADRLRDAVVALDEWLSKGGGLPDGWKRAS